MLPSGECHDSTQKSTATEVNDHFSSRARVCAAFLCQLPQMVGHCLVVSYEHDLLITKRQQVQASKVTGSVREGHRDLKQFPVLSINPPI